MGVGGRRCQQQVRGQRVEAGGPSVENGKTATQKTAGLQGFCVERVAMGRGSRRVRCDWQKHQGQKDEDEDEPDRKMGTVR